MKIKNGTAVIAIIAMCIMTACANNTLDQADAYKIRLEAESESLAAQQSRQQSADLHQYDMQGKQFIADMREANRQTAETIIRVAGWSFTVSLVVTLIGITCAGLYMSYGTSKAYAIFVERRAMVRGATLPMDPKTMSYPVLTVFEGSKIVALTDATTHSTLLVDTNKEPDKLLAFYAGMARRDGKIASEARQSKDANGVTNITPAVIDLKELIGLEAE